MTVTAEVRRRTSWHAITCLVSAFSLANTKSKNTLQSISPDFNVRHGNQQQFTAIGSAFLKDTIHKFFGETPGAISTHVTQNQTTHHNVPAKFFTGQKSIFVHLCDWLRSTVTIPNVIRQAVCTSRECALRMKSRNNQIPIMFISHRQQACEQLLRPHMPRVSLLLATPETLTVCPMRANLASASEQKRPRLRTLDPNSSKSWWIQKEKEFPCSIHNVCIEESLVQVAQLGQLRLSV